MTSPPTLTEPIALGRTLRRRAGDVLAYFDRPGTSNRPTEANNGRLKHLQGPALDFRNLSEDFSDRCSTPAASDHCYTLICDEPRNPAQASMSTSDPTGPSILGVRQ